MGLNENALVWTGPRCRAIIQVADVLLRVVSVVVGQHQHIMIELFPPQPR